MNLLIYFFIFIFKIVEDALSTLRLIVVSNGKKVFGAILQFIVTIIWVVLTGSVLINFMQDFWKVVAFSLGSLFGSYIGSVLEEKIALGNNLFVIKIKEEKIPSLVRIFKVNNIDVFTIDSSCGKFIIVYTARKNTKNVTKFINSTDKDSIILSEKIKIFSHL